MDTIQSRYLYTTHLSVSPRGHTSAEQIVEGSFYVINRSKLPPRTPSLLLQSVRVVMVTVKSDQNLTVRYPSTKSLEAYFMNPSQNLYPEMDEKYIMGSQLAPEVLIRRISSHEFRRNSSLKSFWFEQTSITERPPLPVANCDPDYNMKSKLGSCMSELQSSNIKSWGERRLVSYVRNPGKRSSDVRRTSHYSTHKTMEKSYIEKEGEEIADVAKSAERTLESSPNEDGQLVSDVDIKTEMDSEISTITGSRTKRKRKRKNSDRSTNDETLVPASANKGSNKDPDSYRWGTQRYEIAKQRLYNVMKGRGAAHLNPVSRYALRDEARKQIGDTGLLDHLLKHVVDSLAPCGTERFKRRWDSKGVMEYWLESADLDDIRKEAGVQDPYWVPPPGWKPGDPICNHTSDCFLVISSLKEELAQIRGDMQVRAAAAEKDDSVLSSLSGIESLSSAMVKEKYNEMLKEKARKEQELMEISKFLKKMEELLKEKQ